MGEYLCAGQKSLMREKGEGYGKIQMQCMWIYF